jgi:putative N6-adenine-specific DNA methylase
MSESFFATCPRGLESVLLLELANCGARDLRAVGGGAHFAGDLAVCYRVNLESRIASRVLWRVGAARYRTEQDVYEAARAIPWPTLFAGDCTIRVDVSAIRSPLRSLEFVTLRVKDAVCDRYRDDQGHRPNIDTRTPDVRVRAFLDVEAVTFYLETSGNPLWQRGCRGQTGQAPLRANLAAGIIALSGWRPDEPFFDPMCGSGTFLLEAAAIALRIAPGSRRGFGFEKLTRFDAALWQRLQDEARANERPRTLLAIHGGDLYGAAVAQARSALMEAAFEECVQLKQANVLECRAPAASGVLVTNPPYGVRLSDEKELASFYPKLGDALKARFMGWRCHFFTADLRLAKLIGLRPQRRIPLYNGALECRLFEFSIVAGSMRPGRSKTAL